MSLPYYMQAFKTAKQLFMVAHTHIMFMLCKNKFLLATAKQCVHTLAPEHKESP